jgi:hypothetical protein
MVLDAPLWKYKWWDGNCNGNYDAASDETTRVLAFPWMQLTSCLVLWYAY